MDVPEKERMIKYYEDLYGKYGYDHRSLDWKDPVGQRLRYSVLLSILTHAEKKENFTMLDLGCGLGHMYGFLKDMGFLTKHKINYTGYDISPKLIEAATKKYPEAKFQVKDILQGYFAEKFDYVFSSGVFNIRLGAQAEHDAFVKEMLLRMYEAANFGAAVNFLSVSGLYYLNEKELEKESVYCYYKPEEMLEYARKFAGRFELRHDYHPADFTILLYKERR